MQLFLSTYLPIIIYILLCILIVLLIVICVKVLRSINKVEKIIDDVDTKVKSINGVFHVMDNLTDKLSVIVEGISDSIVGVVKAISNKRKKKKYEEEED